MLTIDYSFEPADRLMDDVWFSVKKALTTNEYETCGVSLGEPNSSLEVSEEVWKGVGTPCNVLHRVRSATMRWTEDNE